jgi:hypothetical protein
MLLSIQETENTILAWIKSCVNEDQLSLCNEAIDRFITDRYKHYASPAEVAMVCSRLEINIENHKKKIIGIGLNQLN